METKLPSNCNQCGNGCPREELRCGRGKAYFRRLESGEPEFQSDDALVCCSTNAARWPDTRARCSASTGARSGICSAACPTRRPGSWRTCSGV